MKRKYFLVVLFLILAIFLSGCSGIVTPATDEAKIKSVINEYYLAINDQNWSKAKGYCVYGSDRYYATCQVEDAINTLKLYCSIVTVNCYIDIYNVYIYGDYSEVYGYGTVVISACGYFESESKYFWRYLQKVGNTWKICK